MDGLAEFYNNTRDITPEVIRLYEIAQAGARVGADGRFILTDEGNAAMLRLREIRAEFRRHCGFPPDA